MKESGWLDVDGKLEVVRKDVRLREVTYVIGELKKLKEEKKK